MRQTVTTKEENEAIKKYITRFIDTQEKFKQTELEYKKERNEFQDIVRDFMGKNGMQKFRFKSPRGTKFSVSDVRQRKVIWLIDMLKQKLPKYVLKHVIKKTYTVNDWNEFKNYMKALGADPKMLISYFDVKEEVDEQALNEAEEQGAISAEDVEGCYEIKESEGYVRITELE